MRKQLFYDLSRYNVHFGKKEIFDIVTEVGIAMEQGILDYEKYSDDKAFFQKLIDFMIKKEYKELNIEKIKNFLNEVITPYENKYGHFKFKKKMIRQH